MFIARSGTGPNTSRTDLTDYAPRAVGAADITEHAVETPRRLIDSVGDVVYVAIGNWSRSASTGSRFPEEL
jgi:hypothetical protein